MTLYLRLLRMLDILAIVSPIYIILCAGYAMTRAGALAMLGGAYTIGRKLAGLSHQQALLHAMGMCSSNSAFIGYPILLLALPGVATTALAPDLGNAAVLMAAMPMMSIYPLLALPYGFTERAAAALVLATVGSFATLSALLWLMGRQA